MIAVFLIFKTLKPWSPLVLSIYLFDALFYGSYCDYFTLLLIEFQTWD